MKAIKPESPIESLQGVGPTRAKQLNKMGIFTVNDLIFNFPRLYEERGNVLPLAYADMNTSYSFVLTVSTEVKNATIRKGMTISKFKAFDETGTVEIIFFNSPYVKELFHAGMQFRFWGKLSIQKNTLQLTNPKYEQIVLDAPLPDFVPVYSLTQGIGTKFVEKITNYALDAVVAQIEDPLPDNIRLKFGFPTISYALKSIHNPKDAIELKKALERIAFDEMLYFGIGISQAEKHKQLGDGIKFSPCDITPLISALPFSLTESQKKTVNDIYKNTVIGENGIISPMARIVVGDVGSGKTICATIAMYIAAKSKYQSALMVPTEILAKQHYNDLNKLFANFGIKVELLLGSTSQNERKRIYSELESGECDVVIGTHAIISDKVIFCNLGLVITDEQHRFGVNQRALLKDKSKRAHMLVMSATPIPRTLALTMYGDLDVSQITEMPKGRQRVDTFVVDESYRTRLNDFILKQISIGGQCYVVCPSIENQDSDNSLVSTESILLKKTEITKHKSIKSATECAENLKQCFPNISIGLLHGKMKAQEKDEIMSAFASGNIKILVSTTVVEVGVNVPNASLMIIENAERFGLSQLHQLRGRVGRGTRKSYCVLIKGIESEKSDARLNIMKETYDGFEIAERDLILRGPGDFFSDNSNNNLRQSGGFNFKAAKLCSNKELFDQAFCTAKEIISEDPTLSLEKHLQLKKQLDKIIKPNYSTIS